MSDVLLYQTVNNGDIIVEDGQVQMTAGFETAVYLSMFGGSTYDYPWFGDLAENEPAYQYKGETERTLKGLPAIPANLIKVEQAVSRDLAWLTSTRAANSVTVGATMPGLNKITITINISAIGEEQQFEYTENWKAAE